jgi:hypothetical protein
MYNRWQTKGDSVILIRQLSKLAAFLAFAIVCPAAPIVYSFVGTGREIPGRFPAEPVGFQLTLSDYVNAPLDAKSVFFSCDAFNSSTNCGIGAYFSNHSVLGTSSAQLQFDASNTVGYAFFFPTGAFTTPGVHTASANGNQGTLTVSGVPEPMSVIFVVSGGLVFSLRKAWQRRLTSNASV